MHLFHCSQGIGPYEFPLKFKWTNGSQISLKVQVETGIGPWSALLCDQGNVVEWGPTLNSHLHLAMYGLGILLTRIDIDLTPQAVQASTGIVSKNKVPRAWRSCPSLSKIGSYVTEA